ncbi:MAG: lipopolysaccharide kinase InaA family protein [Thermodesulfobacteriota bacterium]|nr:lipopolysaccharide kinase InaA family protein [Thermodesulfobacteriota bacterium]
MFATYKDLPLTVQHLRYCISYLLFGNSFLTAGHLPQNKNLIPEDYFGIRVAGSPDPKCGDYVVEALHQLGLQHVRLDFTYSSENSYTKPLLDKLLDNGFRVCLHLIQPLEEARKMNTLEVQTRWRDFIIHTLEYCTDRLEMVEIGSTCNRRKWAGYSLSSFMKSWDIAYEEISKRGVLLAGPNVTDFEPLYNIGLLGIMNRSGTLPTVHSDNLYVERAGEPEAFDHKIAGYLFAPLIKYNLVKKVHTIAGISDYYKIPSTICSHVEWSLKRINRVLYNLEEKQADYLTRYCCLAAASGGFTRIYWGPLIGQQDGLIDDGTSEFPELPHVTLYEKANGQVSDYRIRKAFHSYKTAAKFLSGCEFKESLASAQGLEVHEFIRSKQRMHVAWTTNGNCASVSQCYETKDIDLATAFSLYGERLSGIPSILSESPTYILWPKDYTPRFSTSARIVPGIRISHNEDTHYRHVVHDKYNGLFHYTSNGDDTLQSFLPEELEYGNTKNIMRNKRNCVWSMADPRNPSNTIVVKRHQIKQLHKKLVQRIRPSRAMRSWNGAHELLRRGICTPRPIAFFQQHKNTSIRDSYFVYEMFENTGSMRKAFRAFSEGETEFKGISRDLLYSELADFLNNMHGRGVFFRDLSAGNVLFRRKDNGHVEFCLIDTARAHFYRGGIGLRLRLSDLKRITHPANWKCRKEFITIYMNKKKRGFSWWMKIPLIGYDLKNKFKHKVRGK